MCTLPARPGRLLVPVLLVLSACGTAGGGGDASGPGPGDPGTTADPGTGADAVDGLVENGDGTMTDRRTGLSWQRSPAPNTMDWGGAVDYCENLFLGNRSDWRLPNVDELRSLVVGCPPTRTGGECTLTHGCGDECTNGCCFYACEPGYDACKVNGPTPGHTGCYADPALAGPCGHYFSASTLVGNEDAAWVIDFSTAGIQSGSKTGKGQTRCVR